MLADRAMLPWWYDVVLGVLTATFFASFSLEAAWPLPVAAGLCVLGVGVAFTSRWWSRIHIAELRGER